MQMYHQQSNQTILGGRNPYILLNSDNLRKIIYKTSSRNNSTGVSVTNSLQPLGWSRAGLVDIITVGTSGLS